VAQSGEERPTAVVAATPDAATDLERDGALPDGVNLAWRLRALSLSGRLGAGTKLPGVRELAGGAGVNVNTARSIYRRLEDEGLIVSRHGQGTFVLAHVATSPALEQVAAEAAEAARSLGIDPRDLARTLYTGSVPEQSFGQQSPPPADPDAPLAPPSEEDARAARRALRGQIARLEGQLAAYPEEATEAGIAEAGPEPISGPTARIADIGELEAVRDQLFDRLKRVRALVERKGEIEGAARQRLDRMVVDPASHKWEAVSAEEMGEGGCATYQVQPAWGPVGALMNWWRVKVSSGCPLAGPLKAEETRGADGPSSRR
jgi:DNA-binding transcriptional regulator YhcF (GntR family)